jgi:hypothetical protein
LDSTREARGNKPCYFKMAGATAYQKVDVRIKAASLKLRGAGSSPMYPVVILFK